MNINKTLNKKQKERISRIFIEREDTEKANKLLNSILFNKKERKNEKTKRFL